MSITTKTGDLGTTGLMYNRRVTKCDPRVEACGAVDELNASLGMVRALAGSERVRRWVPGIQRQLVGLMGELATAQPDRDRYLKDGYARMTPDLTAQLDALVARLESEELRFDGWVMPGATAEAAALDLARTACRRAERRVCVLQDAGELGNAEILIYLNRLSDALWLLARWAEGQQASDEREPSE